MAQEDGPRGRPASPRFSIVSIAREALADLKRTRASVEAQNFADYEWIVIDGGSRDGTAAYLASLDDDRLRFVSEPDGGIYSAMNKGIALARGTYLIFMNAGDCFASANELALAAADLADGSVDLLYGDAYEAEGDTVLFKKAHSHRSVWYSMFAHHQAIYYHRRLFAGRRYDESFRLAADWALTAAVLRAGARVAYVARPVCRFLRGGATVTAARALANAEARRVYRDVIGLPPGIWHAVFAVKIGINKIRSRLPGLYDRLRLRRPSRL